MEQEKQPKVGEKRNVEVRESKGRMGVSERDKKWKEKGWKGQEAESEKKRAESKWKKSPKDEGELWDNKKLRGYECNQKAGPEKRDKERKLGGEWRSREGGNQNQDRNRGESS